MPEWMDTLFRQLEAAPALLIYLSLGVAAALENVVPPIPADVVVLFGSLLAGRGAADEFLVFLAVWGGNVAGALLVYALGRRFGPTFFRHGWGRLLLQPRQLESLDGFYRRYGFMVIFFSRFLPMFRAVVPVFAGLSGLGFWRTAIPLAGASAIWYGALVYLGSRAGRNWEQIVASLNQATHWLGLAALAVGVGVGIWWWRSRG